MRQRPEVSPEDTIVIQPRLFAAEYLPDPLVAGCLSDCTSTSLLHSRRESPGRTRSEPASRLASPRSQRVRCWLVTVQRGDGNLQEVEVGAPTKDEALRLVNAELPGVKIVKATLAIWTSA